jgi:hypothetical protein
MGKILCSYGVDLRRMETNGNLPFHSVTPELLNSFPVPSPLPALILTGERKNVPGLEPGIFAVSQG